MSRTTKTLLIVGGLALGGLLVLGLGTAVVMRTVMMGGGWSRGPAMMERFQDDDRFDEPGERPFDHHFEHGGRHGGHSMGFAGMQGMHSRPPFFLSFLAALRDIALITLSIFVIIRLADIRRWWQGGDRGGAGKAGGAGEDDEPSPPVKESSE